MRTIRLSRFVRNRVVYPSLPGLAVFLIALGPFAEPPVDAELRVLKMGLGSGTVTSAPAGIACGADCSETYAPTVSVSLTATPDPGSTFVGWAVDPDGDPVTTPDCSGTSTTCSVPPLTAVRSVRATFGLATPIPTITDFTPDGATGTGGIRRYLNDNPAVNTAARFVAALPAEYRLNWILMSRSESLQPGTADLPRILLPSPNAQSVFTVGMAPHSSYPGAHPNAIEYMQWDPGQKTFRFHEIVLDAIPMMGNVPARTRGISIDDEKCSRCHSTRNVLSLDRSVTPPVPGRVGTDGIPPGTIKVKNKPNWDTYDSWAGMMPFNRDRIYQGSAEAAAFRRLLNPWTWSANDGARAIIEQLRLQPPGVTPGDAIRRMWGGANDGHITFPFDGATTVLTEPAPTGIGAPISTAYSFDGVAGAGTGTSVTRGGGFVLLHHTSDVLGTGVGVEGRGVQLFDLLGGADGSLNQQRIADELITHRWATGSFPIDVRPIALAITRACFTIDAVNNRVTSTPALTINLGFFDTRNGMQINQLVTDTRDRAQNMPRRKADIEKRNQDRTGDPYSSSSSPPLDGLIQLYGPTTSFGTDVSMPRLRQEVFRRPNDLGSPDATVMGGIYVDRELYAVNTPKLALYRYFLEPLGVSVDKWSMGVRGRSRTYSFADVFGTYLNQFIGDLEASLSSNPVGGLSAPPYSCAQLIPAVNSTLASLPDVNEVPKYTDVQRIFNKSCIECHGGLGYPPYSNYGTILNLSENETPPAGNDRLDRSNDLVTSAYTTSDPATSFLYERITGTTEDCPYGLMPCGGPKLSKVDIETIRRWIAGGRPNTRGDPHIETINGVSYDFQSAGEFALLRGQNLEIQARQTAVTTAAPLGPNPHTGLSSCVSVNSAVALRVGRHRITYQPNLSGRPDPEGLQLRVDGSLVQLTAQGFPLDSGGRLIRTTAPGGIQVEAPGGTVVVITPGWWDYYQLWYLNIDAQHARATEGVMGTVAAGNWLPALPDGRQLGPRPPGLHQRYVDLYQRFENAWRVSDATTLFDYAPGTSTSTFTIEPWPVENPQNCTVPPQRKGPPPQPPLPELPLPVAQRYCQAISAANDRANCILDVRATGDTGFARTYLRSQEVEQNRLPPPPRLVTPPKFQTGLIAPVAFTWSKTTDANGDTLTYRHCVWEVTHRYTFKACEPVASPAPSWHRGALWGLLMALLFFLLLVVLYFVGVRRRAVLLSIVAVAIVAVIVAFLIGRAAPGRLSRTVAVLEPGKAYYWKVIAEDGKAGTVESETRRFEIR